MARLARPDRRARLVEPRALESWAIAHMTLVLPWRQSVCQQVALEEKDGDFHEPRGNVQVAAVGTFMHHAKSRQTGSVSWQQLLTMFRKRLSCGTTLNTGQQPVFVSPTFFLSDMRSISLNNSLLAVNTRHKSVVKSL